MTSEDKETTPTAAEDTVLTNLPAAMTGRVSPAKAAVGDKPVFAYIGSLPEPQRSIADGSMPSRRRRYRASSAP